ncbi:hypothetical protein [Embleya sp. NPDC059237]|uniref:hypothetical protein n=1 Tax=Embleya sp. NPDC059237 TaxID=3346784 RepID=UPI00369F49B5
MSVSTHHRPPTPTDPDTANTSAERSVYRERAELIADLAARWPSVLVTSAPDLPEYAIVHIHPPTGPMSWHIHPDDVPLFDHVRRVGADHPRAQWDGHSTGEKYDRLRALRPAPSTAPRPVPGARTLYRDGRGDAWITSATDSARIRALTPESAPPRYATPAAIEHETGMLLAVCTAR